jgi:putative transposase
MSRSPRIQFPGAFYHVTTRGNDKQEMFLSDRDRRVFLDILNEVVSCHSWVCHAYCLMGNHYHLLLETPEANLSEGMHRLNSNYSHFFNDKYEKVGHVIQERFYSRLVRDDRDLFGLFRYVLLNPVKDGLVRSPEQWRWSSYAATAGLVVAQPFLKVDYTLSLLTENPGNGREAFRAFISEGIDELENRLTSLDLILEGPTSKKEQYRAIRKAREEYGYSVREISEFLQIHPATVYRALKR